MAKGVWDVDPIDALAEAYAELAVLRARLERVGEVRDGLRERAKPRTVLGVPEQSSIQMGWDDAADLLDAALAPAPSAEPLSSAEALTRAADAMHESAVSVERTAERLERLASAPARTSAGTAEAVTPAPSLGGAGYASETDLLRAAVARIAANPPGHDPDHAAHGCLCRWCELWRIAGVSPDTAQSQWRRDSQEVIRLTAERDEAIGLLDEARDFVDPSGRVMGYAAAAALLARIDAVGGGGGK